MIKKIKQMKGRETKTKNIIEQMGYLSYSTPETVSKTLAKTFSNVSSSNNYSSEFQPDKNTSEENLPVFGVSQVYYNHPFTHEEPNIQHKKPQYPTYKFFSDRVAILRIR